MQIAILGPIAVRDGERAIEVSGARLRRLLLRLAVDAGRTLSPDDLVDAVWEQDEQPSEIANALQSLVSRLRRALGDASLVQQLPGGYRLAVAPQDVDVHDFARLARAGREQLAVGDAEQAARSLRAALALWRGLALADAHDDDHVARAAATRWDEQRLDVLADRIEADLALGRAAELVGELEELVVTHPLRERFAGQLMTALARAGRSAEALAAYERVRTQLVELLGSDPSPDLQQQHLALLRGQGEPTAPQRRRTNIRVALTSFVGRSEELRRVGDLLAGGRLTTIVGPGGAGKTRLATEVAATWVDRRPDGVWFVELASVTDDGDIIATLLGALGAQENSLLERRTERRARDAMDRLLEQLADADCLLVIDNCEHLVGGVAGVVEQLLSHCPRVRVLATSREPLGIDGESLCSLPSLAVPEPTASPAEALGFASVRLFAERAAAVRAGFVVDAATVADVVQIVRRLDGLPLAIELAAARLRVLPVDEVAARLSDRFRLLTGGSRTALPRHRTLRAVVQWSWDLLTPAERLLAERLAVFPAGASARSAEAVCVDAALPASELPALLDALVDKSLLQLTDESGLRYRMLETIREFGLDRLVERGEVSDVRTTHARYFASLAAEAEPWLRTREQLPWLALLQTERDNLLAALRFLGDSGDAAATLELAESLAWYWTLLGSHGEALTWLGYALSLPGHVDPESRLVAEAVVAASSLAARGRNAPGVVDDQMVEVDRVRHELAQARPKHPLTAVLRPLLATFSGDVEAAERYTEQALGSDDLWVRATVRTFRAMMFENAGEVDRMREDVVRATAEFAEIGDRWGMAATLASMAHLHTMDGELATAVSEYEQAGRYLRELNATADVGMVHLRLAGVRARMGDLEGARRDVQLVHDSAGGSGEQRLLAHIAFVLIVQAGDDPDELRGLRESLTREMSALVSHPMQDHARAIVLSAVASSYARDGELDLAAARLGEAYAAAVATRDMPVVAITGVVLAELALAAGDARSAAELLGAAAALRGSDDETDLGIRRLRPLLRDQLGDEVDGAYARGRGLERQVALGRLDPAAARSSPPS